ASSSISSAPKTAVYGDNIARGVAWLVAGDDITQSPGNFGTIVAHDSSRMRRRGAELWARPFPPSHSAKQGAQFSSKDIWKACFMDSLHRCDAVSTLRRCFP